MPSTPGPRRLQAEERRELILDAALQVFSDKGFAGASMRDIARAAGVTEGLLYHYFEGREQLLQACCRERSWQAHLDRLLAEAAGVPLDEMLRRIVTEFLNTLYAHGPVARMLAVEMQRNPELTAQHMAQIEASHQTLVDFLRHRQSAGEIRADADPDLAAGLLMGSAYSVFLLWGTLPPAEWADLVEHMARAVDVVMRGVAP